MNRFTSLILGALLAGVTSVPVEVVQSQYGPGPSAVPYRPRPAPGPYAAPPPERSYQPEPHYIEKEEGVFEPQPYKYEYGVQDDYSKAAFAKSESQNEVGAVTGSYKVNLPDGRIQTVTYTADPVYGYRAEVSYEGEPIYPPKPEGGYPGEQGSDYQRQGARPAYRGQQAGERVYRESPAPQGPLPGPEYIPSGEQQYLPEYVARVQ